jgi:apolipoprotein N-acyltransferase
MIRYLFYPALWSLPFRYISMVCAGILTLWSFAPWRLWFLMPCSLMLLMIMGELDHKHRRSLTYVWALSAYASQFFWIFHSLHDIGGMPSGLAAVLTLLLPAYLALYPVLAVMVVHRWTSPSYRLFRLVFLWPAAWICSEYLRNHLLTGFGWGEIGYAMIPNVWLAAWAPLGGVLTVSWVLMSLVGLGVYFLLFRSESRPYLAILAFGWFLLLSLVTFAIYGIRWTKPWGTPVAVALVQPNITQSIKWDPLHAHHVFETIQQAVKDPEVHAQLIIFPEAVFPMPWERIPEQYKHALREHAYYKNLQILAGVFKEKPYLNNSALLLTDPREPWQAKQHLLPFGEYVPFPKLTGWIYRYMKIPYSNIAPNYSSRHPIQVLGQMWGSHICYENGFGDELIDLHRRASILVNLSNLGWFGQSQALGQHLQISQARSLESGRFMVQSTNNGMSAIINDQGQIISITKPHELTILQHYVEGRVGDTPYLLWASWPVLLWSVLMLIFAKLWNKRSYRKKELRDDATTSALG